MVRYARFGKKKGVKKDYYDRISRPFSYQVAPLVVLGGLFILGMLKEKRAESFNASVDEPHAKCSQEAEL